MTNKKGSFSVYISRACPTCGTLSPAVESLSAIRRRISIWQSKRITDAYKRASMFASFRPIHLYSFEKTIDVTSHDTVVFTHFYSTVAMYGLETGYNYHLILH